MLLSGRGLKKVPDWVLNLTKAEHLDLSDNQLTELPPELADLTELTELALNGNALREVPWPVSGLTKLTRLNLSNAALTSLSHGLGGLKTLEYLDLSGNHLGQDPSPLDRLNGLTRLLELKLGGNQLTVLPDSLRDLPRLRKLDLSRNRLTSVPKSLRRLTDLSTLDLSDNPLRSLPSWLSADGTGKPQVIVTGNTTLSYGGQRLDHVWIRLRSLFVPSVSLAAVRAASKADNAAAAILQLYEWERDRLLTLAKGTAGAAVTVFTGLIATAVEEKTALDAITLVPTAALVVMLLGWSGFILTGLRRLAEDYSTALTIKR